MGLAADLLAMSDRKAAPKKGGPRQDKDNVHADGAGNYAVRFWRQGRYVYYKKCRSEEEARALAEAVRPIIDAQYPRMYRGKPATGGKRGK